METKKTILTGTAIATAILGAASLKASANLFDFTSLGSGSEVRSVLLNNAPSAVKYTDLNCGEKKDAANKDAKTKDAKCGDKKEAKSKDAKCGDKKEAKSKDAKCGEGKCGGSDKKAKTAEQPK